MLDMLWRWKTQGREMKAFAKALGNSWPELRVDAKPMLYPLSYCLLNCLGHEGANTMFLPAACSQC